MAPIAVALVGFGYWGPNLARCIAASESVELAVVCEQSEARARAARAKYPWVRVRRHVESVFDDPAIKAVILATPTETHARLALRALEHGKHVFVEKPLASISSEAIAMAAAAERHGLVLMVDHTYLFSPGLATVRRLMVERDLGPIRYYHSVRSNCFGPPHETGVLWDLAVHDLSILDDLMTSAPANLHAAGLRTADGRPDSHAQLILTYPDRALASVLVSWIAPAKVRQIVIGFDRHTIEWDDLAADGTVRLFDRGLEPLLDPGNRREPRTVVEKVPVAGSEPLAAAVEHFAKCISERSTPRSSAATGVRVVRLLEMAECSRSGSPRYASSERAREAG